MDEDKMHPCRANSGFLLLYNETKTVKKSYEKKTLFQFINIVLP